MGSESVVMNNQTNESVYNIEIVYCTNIEINILFTL